jgi:hypothetical protein
VNETLTLADVEAVLDDKIMRERDRLRPACRTGTVEDDGIVHGARALAGRGRWQRRGRISRGGVVGKAAIAPDQQHRTRPRGHEIDQQRGIILPPETGHGHQDISPGLAQQQFQFPPGGPSAERSDHRTKQPGPERNFQPFGPVVDEQANPPAAADPMRAQNPGGLAGTEDKIAPSQRLAARDHRHRVAAPAGRLFIKQFKKRAAVRRLHDVSATCDFRVRVACGTLFRPGHSGKGESE